MCGGGITSPNEIEKEKKQQLSEKSNACGSEGTRLYYVALSLNEPHEDGGSGS